MNPWIHYSVSIGPDPGYTCIAFKGAVGDLVVAASQDGTPVFHPGLEITKSFYGRMPWRPDSLADAVEGIGPDAKAYLYDHPDERPLRIQHYPCHQLEHWPDLAAEADARPVGGDPAMMEEGVYRIAVFDADGQRTDEYVEAESAAHAMLYADIGCHWNLQGFGFPARFRGEIPAGKQLHDAVAWSMETGIDDFPDLSDCDDLSFFPEFPH